MHLTALSEFIKLREKHRKNPACIRPALSASLKVARRMGKGPYFARQIRQNEWHILKHGYLPLSKSQKQSGHHTLMDNEQVVIGVCRYLAAQDLGTISPQAMVKHLRDVLLPALGFNGQSTEITEKTARNWLHALGFEYMGQAQAVFTDGHERKDVKEARKIFLEIMAHLEPLMIRYEGDDMTPIYPTLAPGQKVYIVVNHDESIFHVNDMKRRMWLQHGQQPIKKKGNGRSIHVSDFICEQVGRLRLVDDVLEEHEKLPLDSPLRLPTTEARKIIYPGKNHDKWWDVNQLMTQLKTATDIFERQFPDAIGVWIFDCSSSHEALAPDALNVNQMNVNPGGNQWAMRDTIIPFSNPPPCQGQTDSRGQHQSLVYLANHPDANLRGRAKGMKAMLKERTSVWERLCAEHGSEKKVIGKCKTCKLSAAKKDAMKRIAEAEAAGQDETVSDADVDAANTAIPKGLPEMEIIT